MFSVDNPFIHFLYEVIYGRLCKTKKESFNRSVEESD